MQIGTETTGDPPAQGSPATEANRIRQDVPLPSPNDDPPTLLAKLTTVVAIVSDDRSVAAATEKQETSTLQRDAGKAALAQMRPMERESWEAYLRRLIQLPYMHWNANQDLAPLRKKPLRTARMTSASVE